MLHRHQSQGQKSQCSYVTPVDLFGLSKVYVVTPNFLTLHYLEDTRLDTEMKTL